METVLKKKKPGMILYDEIHSIIRECQLNEKEINALYDDVIGMSSKDVMEYVKGERELSDAHHNEILHKLGNYRLMTKAKKKYKDN